MNARTRNPPAKTASGTTSHHDTARLRYMRYQTSARGPRVLTICQIARHVEGVWYCSTISFQAAVSVDPAAEFEVESFVIILKKLRESSFPSSGILRQIGESATPSNSNC